MPDTAGGAAASSMHLTASLNKTRPFPPVAASEPVGVGGRGRDRGTGGLLLLLPPEALERVAGLWIYGFFQVGGWVGGHGGGYTVLVVLESLHRPNAVRNHT